MTRNEPATLEGLAPAAYAEALARRIGLSGRAAPDGPAGDRDVHRDHHRRSRRMGPRASAPAERH